MPGNTGLSPRARILIAPNRAEFLPLAESPKPWQVMLLALITVTALATVKFRSDEFRRPLGEDELITLRVYTGAGANGDGTPRDLSRHGPLRNLRPLSPSELAIGFYASFGRWAEPNNHVVHSAAVNLMIGRIQPIEAAVRLPALIAAMVFALALAWLCVVCGRGWGAPVAAALAMVWPYVSWYSMESRGYALMMLFCVLFVLAARWLLARPGSVLAGAALTAVSALTVMNLVNLSADWIAPGFLLIFLFPRWIQPDIDDIKAVRKSLVAVGLATAAILGVFLMDRLPFLVSAMNQYGVPYSGTSGYVVRWREVLDYLFPAPLWVGVGIVGMLGALFAARTPGGRGPIAVGSAAIFASATHFAAAGKFPYLRNCGYLLLPILFGVAATADLGIRTVPSTRMRWLTMVLLAGAIALFEQIQSPANPDPQYAAFAQTFSETPVDGTPGRVILERGVSKSLDLYFPQSWESIELPFPMAGPVDLIRVTKTGDEYTLKRQRYTISDTGPADWVVWHPPFAVTAVAPDAVLAELKRAGANSVVPYHSRYQAKLSILSRVTVILVEGTDEAALRAVADKDGGALVRMCPAP